MVLHRRKFLFVFAIVSICFWIKTNFNSTKQISNSSKFVRQIHLCRSDFQRTLHLTSINRTFILYEVEWNSRTTLNILSVIVETRNTSMKFIGNFLNEIEENYSIECREKNFRRQAQLKYYNMHEYDRTVLIQCQTNEIDENQNSTFELRFKDLKTNETHSIDFDLCWSNDRRATIGHCHKALFENVEFYLIEQWLNYHISIGVEIFYIYDRTLKYENQLESFIQRGFVVYVPFPLSPEFAEREHFNWIDQFVGKMHCLLHVRLAFDWLGTWDIDEYLNFFDEHTPIYLPQYDRNGRFSSMLSEYLTTNFFNYSNIIIYASNFLGKRSLTSSDPPVVIEQYQHRLTKWNDRVKYLVRPQSAQVINIHYALYIGDNGTYESYVKTPEEISSENRRSLIRLNHYASAQIVRDDLFFNLHPGKIEFTFDPLIQKIFFRLENEKIPK